MRHDDSFKIYIEQLRDGRTETLNETYHPDFLSVTEEELKFKTPVRVNGEAYLADDNLIIRLAIATDATIPCSICNEPVEVEINLLNFYHLEPIEEIKGSVFEFDELLREAILLEVPKFGECHDGSCPERQQLIKYLKTPKNASQAQTDDQEGYHPFADLDPNKFT